MKRMFTNYPSTYVKASTSSDYWDQLEDAFDTIIFNKIYDANVDLDSQSVVNDAFDRVGYPPEEDFPNANTNINIKNILRSDNSERDSAMYKVSRILANDIVSRILDN